MNMDDATETDISVAFAEHLLRLLAPGKTYRADARSEEKRCCRCGCDAFPTFNKTGIGHEEVWHGYVDLVLPSCPIPYDDMPSIAKIVVPMEEEKQLKKRKLESDGVT